MSLVLSASPEQLHEQFLRLQSAQDVANLLEIDIGHLNYHLYRIALSTQYATFNIPKKSGGTRQISAPISALKIIQRKLNQVLQHVYEPKTPVHSFCLGSSIRKNAEIHVRRRHLLNVDLKDFFPSINFGRVRGMFMGSPYRLVPAAATVLAQICCFENQLPQGAPTSPIVSNMICARLDGQLQQLAKRHRCLYTRYADDITFSISLREFPASLAHADISGGVIVGDELDALIKDNGFKVNPAKVRLRTRNRRLEVTGLTVNERVNVRRRYIRQIRAMLHDWEKNGLAKAEVKYYSSDDMKYSSPFKPKPRFKHVVKGKIEFLGMVRGKGDHIYDKFRQQLRLLAPELVPKEPLLRMFENFEASTEPQSRGYLLEELLNQTFKLHEIAAVGSFRRAKGGEQIDGGFTMESWNYLVECRWRQKLSGIRDLDGLLGQLIRSSAQTMGVFISINGWSRHVPKLLTRNPDKRIVLMNGEDLRRVLSREIDLKKFIQAKFQHLSFNAEPYYGAEQYLIEKSGQ